LLFRENALTVPAHAHRHESATLFLGTVYAESGIVVGIGGIQ